MRSEKHGCAYIIYEGGTKANFRCPPFLYVGMAEMQDVENDKFIDVNDFARIPMAI